MAYAWALSPRLYAPEAWFQQPSLQTSHVCHPGAFTSSLRCEDMPEESGSVPAMSCRVGCHVRFESGD